MRPEHGDKRKGKREHISLLSHCAAFVLSRMFSSLLSRDYVTCSLAHNRVCLHVRQLVDHEFTVRIAAKHGIMHFREVIFRECPNSKFTHNKVSMCFSSSLQPFICN